MIEFLAIYDVEYADNRKEELAVIVEINLPAAEHEFKDAFVTALAIASHGKQIRRAICKYLYRLEHQDESKLNESR